MGMQMHEQWSHGNFGGGFGEWQQEAQGKKAVCSLKRNIFSLLDHHHAPKLTPLFHPESDKEANKVIQERGHERRRLACLNEGLHEFN